MHIFLSLIVLFFVEIASGVIFLCIGASGNVTAACLAGIAIVGGYFITHYLELLRLDDERKYNLDCAPLTGEIPS